MKAQTYTEEEVRRILAKASEIAVQAMQVVAEMYEKKIEEMEK
jgi:hypothetical protein